MKSELDVLVVGGYGLIDNFDGSEKARDKMRLTYKGQVVSLDLVKHLLDCNGDLAMAEQRYLGDPALRQFPRQLNTIMLYDILSRLGYRTEAVNYFAFEKERFEKLMALKPRVLALSTTFISDPAHSVEIARRAKELSPDTIVIAGGIKVLKSARQLLLSRRGCFDGLDERQLAADSFFYSAEADEGIDAFVVDEVGLGTLETLIKRISDGDDWRSLPNVVFWQDGALISTERSPEKFSFEQYVIDWRKIPEYLVGAEIPVRAGVGCPFKCAFCDFADLLTKTTLRPIESVLSELKQIQEVFPGRPIFFTDDNLFVNKKRTRQLCEGIVEAGLKFRWRAFFRVDAVDEQIAALAAAAGCSMALLGVESGDPTVLLNMDKRTTPLKAVRAVSALDNHGVNTVSFLIVGYPGERPTSIANTADLMNLYPTETNSLHTFYPLIFIVTPLSPAASPAKRSQFGLKGLWFDWSHDTMDVDQAKVEYERLVRRIRVPLLQYPEQAVNDLPPKLAMALMKTRQALVDDGISELTAANAQTVYRVFKAAAERSRTESPQAERACA